MVHCVYILSRKCGVGTANHDCHVHAPTTTHRQTQKVRDEPRTKTAPNKANSSKSLLWKLTFLVPTTINPSNNKYNSQTGVEKVGTDTKCL